MSPLTKLAETPSLDLVRGVIEAAICDAGIDRREPRDGFPNADRVMEYALMLPTHQGLTEEDVDYVIEVLEKALT